MTRVNPYLRTIFLCNPKVASTSIEKALDKENSTIVLKKSGELGLKHSDAIFLKNDLSPFVKQIYPNIEFTSFCVVREPMYWLYSWWSYRSRQEIINTPNSTSNICFDEFVLDYLRFQVTGEAPVHAQLKKQSDFVLDEGGNIVIDKVFALDKLHELEKFISTRGGKKIHFPHLNKTHVKPSKLRASASRIHRFIRGNETQNALTGPVQNVNLANIDPASLLNEQTINEARKVLANDFLIYSLSLISPDACRNEFNHYY